MAWTKVASLHDVPDGKTLGINVDGIPVALYNLGGEVYATHGICTHALALLSEGWIEDGKIECPLHQGQFDIRSGKALCSPITEDVRTYAVRVDGGAIFIDMEQPAAFSLQPRTDDRRAASASDNRAVIVGAGQAAAAAIRALRSAGFDGSIDLVGAEPHLPYERPPLSKDILLGKAAFSDCARLTEQDATQHNVRLHLATRATAIDPQQRSVTLDSGQSLPYDCLLIATGGEARRLPIAGADLAGVHYLRTIEDAAAIGDALGRAQHVAIIGGGFIGLELASTAIASGVAVTLLEREREIMARLMPPALGRAFGALARRHGVDIRRDAAVTAITRRGDKLGVVTGDDTIEVDAVLVGIGMQPSLDLARQAGCATTAGGIEVDAEGRTSVAGIWAAGDCALYHEAAAGRRFSLESWQNAEEQGAAAGHAMAGQKAPAQKRPWFWTDQFGCNIQMLGLVGPNDRVAFSGTEEAAPGAVYRAFDAGTGRLTGVVAFSDPHAIRAARTELSSNSPFDPAANGAILLPDALDDTDSLMQEDSQMNVVNPSLSLTKRYIWPAEGLTKIPDWVYTDQTIYEREVEKIFHGRTWNYVALEAEVPNVGDYIRSHVGPTPVVVARAEDGSINVFENRCAHRAAEFCRDLSGNAKEFVCPYHQWSYDLKGNLAGVPFRRGVAGKGGMPADFKNADHGLRRLKVTSHRGVVFASYCDDMEPLADYLGPEIMEEFEATFDGRKLTILGYYRHSLPGNWKLYHENLKDPYHATLLHTFLVTFGLLVAGNKSLMLADPSGRHGVMASAKSDAKSITSDAKKEMRAFKEGMTLEEPRFMDFVDEFKSPWSVTMATIWPNLIVQREMNTLGVRQIVPTGPHEFIMKWTMFGFEGDSDEMLRHRLRQGNLMGPAGFLGLEDNEAIKFVQDGMQRVPNGEHLVKLDPAVEAGTADNLISESAIRAMYKHWRAEMGL